VGRHSPAQSEPGVATQHVQPPQFPFCDPDFPGVIFRLIEDQDVQSCTEICSSCFTQGEPTSKHLKVPLDVFEIFVRPLVIKAVAERLSIVAIDAETSAVKSFLICDDLFGAPPADMQVPTILEPIFAVINTVEGKYHDFLGKESVGLTGTFAHWFMGGTNPQVESKGLSTKIRNLAEHHHRSLGFKFAVSESFTPITQHINIKKLGFVARAQVTYSMFELNGVRPFEGLEGCVILCEKEL